MYLSPKKKRFVDFINSFTIDNNRPPTFVEIMDGLNIRSLGTINWYVKILGCTIGRKSENWVDFNFFGHQISAHKINKQTAGLETNPVDGYNIPSRHFGIILNMKEFWEIKLIVV